MLRYLALFLVLVSAFAHPHEDAAQSVRPRALAPNFKAKAVINDNFVNIELKDFRGKQWVVLLFYPYDYTFVCPTEIISFSENHHQFASINATVLAISTDSHHTHLAWTRMSRDEGGVGKLNIPLVADTSKRISRDYGVLVTDEEDDMFGAALRGLFIIDPKGKVRSIQINDDAVGRSHEETLRILQAFQWADSHAGEACPASWKPGQDTIKTNPYESKEYFKAHYANL